MSDLPLGLAPDPHAFDPEERWRVVRTCGAYRHWRLVRRAGECFWHLESDWGQALIMGLVVPRGDFSASVRLDLSGGRRGGMSLELYESLQVGRAGLGRAGQNGLPSFGERWLVAQLTQEGSLVVHGQGPGRTRSSTLALGVPAETLTRPTTLTASLRGPALHFALDGEPVGAVEIARRPEQPMFVQIGGNSPDDPPGLRFGAITIATNSVRVERA